MFLTKIIFELIFYLEKLTQLAGTLGFFIVTWRLPCVTSILGARGWNPSSRPRSTDNDDDLENVAVWEL